MQIIFFLCSSYSRAWPAQECLGDCIAACPERGAASRGNGPLTMTPAKAKPILETRLRRELEAASLKAERRYRTLVERADFIERQRPSPRSPLWEELPELAVER